MRPFTILPMMIVVAMLSFSVRLADFYAGVSSLSGAAVAGKTKKKSEKPKEEAHNTSEDHADLSADEHEKDGMEEHAEEQDHETIKPEDWRDAGDEDIGLTSIKIEMYEDLVARRKALDQREQQLQTREALLSAGEMELDRKYQELSHLRTKIEGLLKQQSEEEKARIASLVKIYEGMKAKEAAAIFNTLDMDILILMLGNMSERKLSPILAKMNPERARAVTILLTEEKQLPTLE